MQNIIQLFFRIIEYFKKYKNIIYSIFIVKLYNRYLKIKKNINKSFDKIQIGKKELKLTSSYFYIKYIFLLDIRIT